MWVKFKGVPYFPEMYAYTIGKFYQILQENLFSSITSPYYLLKSDAETLQWISSAYFVKFNEIGYIYDFLGIE